MGPNKICKSFFIFCGIWKPSIRLGFVGNHACKSHVCGIGDEKWRNGALVKCFNPLYGVSKGFVDGLHLQQSRWPYYSHCHTWKPFSHSNRSQPSRKREQCGLGLRNIPGGIRVLTDLTFTHWALLTVALIAMSHAVDPHFYPNILCTLCFALLHFPRL